MPDFPGMTLQRLDDLQDDFLAEEGDIPLRQDRGDVDRFNANPPPLPARSESYLRSRMLSSSPTLGTTRQYWVDDFSSSGGNWEQIPVTLRA
jgi:hypothetical protein